MTCKDCPHFDVCKMYGALPTKRRINSKWKNCPFRNDKSKYIELPCNVGDKIYCDGKYFANHCAGKVMEFIVGDVKTNVCTYFRGEIDMIFRFSDFGKEVFLTREEAEKSIKELNSNEKA